MQRSTDRIYTTHVGSLARPAALLDLMRASAAGEPVEEAELDAAHRRAVADVVARQRAAGIDVINDGEQGKTGFFAYIAQRLSGYEPRGRDTLGKFRPEIEEFPEYYGPRHQHRRAPGHDRRPHRQVRRGRRQGERGRQRRLRLLFPSHLHPRDPPEDRLGQARIASGRCPSRLGAALVAGR
jgi:Cobalamin-independent synthase, Catalytic domain